MATRQQQNKNLEKTILAAFVYIKKARTNIVPNLENILKMTSKQRDMFLKRLLKENSNLFTLMYNPVETGVINSYNISLQGYNKFYSRFGDIDKPKVWKTIPKTNPFKITNKYLKKASVVKRGLINANDLNKIIKQGVQKGWSYQQTGKQIEIKLGYRDKKTGKLTKGLPKNGIHYQTSTIARQETRRANGIAQYDQYVEASENGINTRIKMIARVIGTSREQSVIMNGQLDGEAYGGKGSGNFNMEKIGLFQYPDGNWYKFSEAPMKWSINDREYCVPIIINGISEELADKQSKKEEKIAKKLDFIKS